MQILGIETSNRQGSVALLRPDSPASVRELPQSGLRHAQSLASEVKTLLNDAGSTRNPCDIVAVSIGPGSFTGLRIGLVFAKTFAYATGCQLATVDTFRCIAEGAPESTETLFVIDDAQRGDLAVAKYERSPSGDWNCIEEVSLHDAEQWCSSRTGNDTVTGPGINKYEAMLQNSCQVLAPEFRRARAETIAKLGAEPGNAVEPSRLWTIEPAYIRPSAAEEKRFQPK